MILLNHLQQIFVDMAINWFHNSSSTLLQLAGYAGTGKSVVISEILNRLQLKEDEVLPMAYTGQACTIMRKRGLKNACTCHSGLFTPVQEIEKDINGNVKMNKTFNVPIITWKFIPKDFSNSNIKLIILDEAWMIPKKFRKFIDATGIKVIAAGDPGQLPPIGDDPGYLVDGSIFFLTELMRQSETSPIVYIANNAREGKYIEPGLYGDEVLVIFDDELDNEMLSRSNIVLCGKNTTRDTINTKIRNEILGVYTNFPVFGERVICRKNNWSKAIDGIPLVNGLIGSVITPPDVGRFNGDLLSIDFLPDLINSPFINIDINYKYLNATYQEKESLKMNPYLMGERFEYAYASTVHLSQGSEYSSGTYIEEFMRADLQNMLNYTAITRFKNKLIYVKHKPKYWSL